MIYDADFTYYAEGVESAKRAAADLGAPIYVKVNGFRSMFDYFTVHPDGVVVAMKAETVYRPVGNIGVTKP